METYSEKLLDYRRQNNITEKELARLIRVKEKDIICWERELALPKLKEAKLIDDFFNCKKISNDSKMTAEEITNSKSGITYGQALSNRRKELSITMQDFAEALNIGFHRVFLLESDSDIPTNKEKVLINAILKTEISGIHPGANRVDSDSQEEEFGLSKSGLSKKISRFRRVLGIALSIAAIMSIVLVVIFLNLPATMFIYMIVFIPGGLLISLPESLRHKNRKFVPSEFNLTLSYVGGIIVMFYH